jgi:PKD repeat protein
MLLAAVAIVAAAANASAASTSLSPDGAWTYFTEPRAVNYAGSHRRTYVGWIDSRGQIVVSSYDHDTRVRTRAVVQTGERVDDHNNPSLIVRADGRLLVFYSVERRRHLVSRLSRRPEDVTAWGPARRLRTNVRGRHGYTYPNPVWLADEQRPLFLFWRGGSFEPTFSTSVDSSSWTQARRWIAGNGQRPYVVFDSNGRDRIDFALSDGNPSELATSIYYMRYRDGRLKRGDGTRIARFGRRAVSPSEADVVYTGGGSRPRAWAYDVGVAQDGQPVVLYATFPSATDHRYHYARWTGRRWLSHEITVAGPTIEQTRDPYYAGGLVFDSRDPSIVYLARAVGGVYQIERWVTDDGGASWRSRPVTSNAAGNYRPVSVQGPSFGRHYDLFWMRGRYTTWLDFGTSIRARLRRGLGHVPNGTFESARQSTRAFAFEGAAARRRVWRFGDGSGPVSGERVRHAYERRGRYTVVSTAFGRPDARVRRDVFVREVRAR